VVYVFWWSYESTVVSHKLSLFSPWSFEVLSKHLKYITSYIFFYEFLTIHAPLFIRKDGSLEWRFYLLTRSTPTIEFQLTWMRILLTLWAWFHETLLVPHGVPITFAVDIWGHCESDKDLLHWDDPNDHSQWS